jgi:hypothetical protein
MRAAPAAASQPVRIVPLLLHAIWEAVARLFRRKTA